MPTLRIERMGLFGDGVAKGPVHVVRALPGEVVSGEVKDGRMTRPKIDIPSAERVSPPCIHYRTCGGCALQHASDVTVAAFKTDVVRTALSARGIEAEVELVHTSPRRTRRRATFSGRRTKAGAILGFHAPQSDVLTDVTDCLVITPALGAALPLLRDMTRAFGSRRGEMKFAVTETVAGLDIDISGPPPPDALRLSETAAVLRDAGVARLTWDGEVIAQFAAPAVRIAGVTVPLPPRGFLQATEGGEAALIAEVLAGLSGMKGPVIDLFAGIGTFSFPLAARHPVHAVESDAAALGALDAGWRGGAGLQAVTTERRDLFRRPVLSDRLDDFAAAVIDPPRAGAAEQIAQTAASGLRCVVHVSCNPVTFARDAATLLAAGFVTDRVAVVDQFRWSSHVEMVSVFRR